MIDLSGRPPDWPAEVVDAWAECAQRAVRRPDLWREPAPRGDELLRQMLGEHLGLDPEHLTITASLRAAVLTYARHHERVLLERPTYQGVADTVVAAGAEVTFHPWTDLLDHREPGRTLVWLTAPCRNPDGADLSAPDRDRLTRLVAAGQRVVVNGTYAWFARDHRWPEDVELAGSLHKLCGLGVRLGWVFSRTFFDEAFAEMLGTTPSRVWQHAWALFFRDGGYAALHRRLIAPSLESAAAFVERLATGQGLPAPAGSGTNLVRPLGPHVDEATALSRLAERGVRASAGSAFRCETPALRFTFTGITPAEAVRGADIVAASGVLAADGRVPAVSR